MICFDCKREFRKGDTVYQLILGTFDGDYFGDRVTIDDILKIRCEDCERKKGRLMAGSTPAPST